MNNCSRYNILLHIYEVLLAKANISDDEYKKLKYRLYLDIQGVMVNED